MKTAKKPLNKKPTNKLKNVKTSFIKKVKERADKLKKPKAANKVKISKPKAPIKRTSRKVVKPNLAKAILLIGGASKLAKEIDYHQSFISQLLYKPDLKVPLKMAEKIEKATKGKVKVADLVIKKAIKKKKHANED